MIPYIITWYSIKHIEGQSENMDQIWKRYSKGWCVDNCEYFEQDWPCSKQSKLSSLQYVLCKQVVFAGYSSQSDWKEITTLHGISRSFTLVTIAGRTMLVLYHIIQNTGSHLLSWFAPNLDLKCNVLKQCDQGDNEMIIIASSRTLGPVFGMEDTLIGVWLKLKRQLSVWKLVKISWILMLPLAI